MDSTIRVKVLGHPDNADLPLKYLDTKEWITPKTSPDGKRITGLDENSYEISLLSGEEKVKEKARIKALREELQEALNIDDLSANAIFWDKFYVVIGADLTFEPENALNKLQQIFLIANKAIAPSEESIETDERFAECVYFFYEESEQRTAKTLKDENTDKAIASAWTIKNKNPERLKYIFSYIFGYGNEDMSIEQVYSKTRDFLLPQTDKGKIDAKQQKKNVDAFLKVVDLKKEQVFVKVMLDRAIKKGVVRVSKQVHTLKDNNIELGRNFEKSLEYLLSSEGSADLEVIKKLVI